MAETGGANLVTLVVWKGGTLCVEWLGGGYGKEVEGGREVGYLSLFGTCCPFSTAARRGGQEGAWELAGLCPLFCHRVRALQLRPK